MIRRDDDDRMDFREATAREHALVSDLVSAIVTAIGHVAPDETEFPGITGLMVTSLVHVAGELLQGVPKAQRASVLAHYQGYMAAAAGEAATVQ